MAEIFLKICDACAREDASRQVPATDTIRLTIDDESVRIDACDRHGAELREALTKIKDVGWQDQPVAAPSSPRAGGSKAGRKSIPELLRSPGSTGCPVCFRLLSTPGNMAHHLKKMHMRKAEEWSKEDRDRATREARRRLAEEIAKQDSGEATPPSEAPSE